MTSGTSLPATKYQFGARRSRDKKFKWYLILAISVVFIILAVTVVALTIYLTSETDTELEKDSQVDTIESDTGQDISSSTITPTGTTTHSSTPPSGTKTPPIFIPSTQSPTTPTPAATTTSRTTTSATLKPTTKISTTSQASTVTTTTKTTAPTKTTTTTTTTISKASTSTTTQSVTSTPTTTSQTTTLPQTTTKPATSTTASTSKPSTTTVKSTTISTTTAPSTSEQTSPTTSSTVPSTTQSISTSSSTSQPSTTPETTSKLHAETTSLDPTTPSSTTSTTTATTTPKSSSTTTTVPDPSTTLASEAPTPSTTPEGVSSSPTPSTTTGSSPYITLKGETLSSSTPFLLTCEAKNIPGWQDLKIRRHHGNNQIDTVAEMKAGSIVPTVTVFDNTMTFSATHHTDQISISLMAYNFDCKHAGNYSCEVSSATTALLAETDVEVISDPPEIHFPAGIVEDQTMSLECIVEFIGTSGDIKWTFSPPGPSDTFYDLSIKPDTKSTNKSCTLRLESKLTFTPGMYDNASNFRCEVMNAEGYNGTTILQTTMPFYVLDTSICKDRKFEILNHPYQPCDKIVYCSENGPIVYQIKCPINGQCYDAKATQCVPSSDGLFS